MRKSVFNILHFAVSLTAACLLHMQLAAQSCSLQFTYTTSASQCMATGSVTVTAGGGSGSYNYKVTGPVSTPFTSSNVITGLRAGLYKVIVKDVNNNCQAEQDSVIVGGNYSDPRFELTGTDVTCAGNDGTITMQNLQHGLSPFTYTIVAPSPSQTGSTNATGSFTGLTPGQYYIQLQDSCGGVQVRSFTINNYSWQFNNYSIIRVGCDSADAVINLFDNKGNTNSGVGFTGFIYGILGLRGLITWFNTSSFRFYIGNKHSITLVAKDNCGHIQSAVWNVPAAAMPSANATVTISNQSCTTFTASISGQQNLTNPQYCLYDNANNQIACNSTGAFNNLTYGSYCINIRDVCYDTTISRCFSAARSVPAITAPVQISNTTCSAFTATVSGQQNLSNPQYCLYDSTHTKITCNSNGIFTNIPYGRYSIEVKDGCVDTTIIQSLYPHRPLPQLTGVNTGNATCSAFDATVSGSSNLINPQYCLYDSNGHVITCNSTGSFTGLTYGPYCIKATTPCGDTSNAVCFGASYPLPSAGAVQISNTDCNSFAATLTGQQALINPQYCLYDSTNTQIACNATGIFDHIPYGSYCIKIKDGCIDTTLTRCFAQYRALPYLSATMIQSNVACASFSATVYSYNMFNPQYYLYDSLNRLVTTNTGGVFDHLSYGRYCAQVKDGCTDTTLSICQAFTFNHAISVTATKTCNIGTTDLQVTFSGPGAPYTITVYRPDNTIAYTDTTNNNISQVDSLPALAPNQNYKVVGINNCGNKDSAYVTPDVTQITKSVSVTSKCPSAIWQTGSGELSVTCTSNLYPVVPAIVAKDGAAFSAPYNYTGNNNFVFSDLGPATYVIQYTLQNCSGTVYDTVTIKPYTFPVAQQTSIYQCNNNSFSVGAAVAGGISPYAYEIIGSQPGLPDIAAPKQSSPVFNINNGTIYSLIRLRTTDACGNATLNDVSVLPLQNIVVTSNTTCLYHQVTLSVDSIPNATYQWYIKRTATDSSLVSDSVHYNILTLQQEQTGMYVCKVSVNNNCLTRISYFNLTGDCGYNYLPIAAQLTAKTVTAGNELTWVAVDDQDILEYRIERKTGSSSYQSIGTVKAGTDAGKNRYIFMDNDPADGANIYRIKTMDRDGKVSYSNIVQLSNSSAVTIYPNPVRNELHIVIHEAPGSNYRIELFNAAGQIIYRRKLNNTGATQLTYHRESSVKPGICLLKVIDAVNGTVQVYKVLFE